MSLIHLFSTNYEPFLSISLLFSGLLGNLMFSFTYLYEKKMSLSIFVWVEKGQPNYVCYQAENIDA